MQNRVTIKAVTAPAYEGKPAWHGQFRIGDSWLTVRNGAGLPIAYASEQAALAGAEYTQAQVLLHKDD